jgi:NADPH:quinone reductase-like Zn-dependent oxidoreductase
VVVDPSLAEVHAGSKLAGMGDLYGDLGIIGGTVAGGYAERCLVPASHVHRIPDSMSWHQAACFPTAWLTAWHALFPVGRLVAGETMTMGV